MERIQGMTRMGCAGALRLCRRRARGVVGLVLLVSVLARGAAAAEPADVPSVTLREAAFLDRVRTVAATNTAAALDLFETRELDAASPALDFVQGNLCVAADRWSDAVRAYSRALDKMPAFTSARVHLGRAWLLQGEPAKAVEVFAELVRRRTADADTLVLMGQALLLQTRSVAAESAFRQALLLEPGGDAARLGLIKALLLQDRTAEAAALCRAVLADDPARAELWALQANADMAREKPHAALVTLETARRLGVADGHMLALLGDLYLNDGQADNAVEAYEAAFEAADPALDRMLRAAGALLQLGRTDGAERLLDRAEVRMDRSGGDVKPEMQSEYLLLRGRVDAARDRPEAAGAAYRQAVALDPVNGDALLALARWQQDQGEADAAELTLERAARIEGYEARAMLEQAELAVRGGALDKAVRLLEAAVVFSARPDIQRYLDQIRRLAEQRSGDR